MKKTLIVANWKSNKTKSEARNWILEVSRQKFPDSFEVIIFPPFTLLDFLDAFIKANNLPFKLGAQDLSPFESGAYTGEISALQIKEFADYVLIGHSERRTNFSESLELVRKKTERAIAQGLIPIICISDIKQTEGLDQNEIIFAYEPLGSIGTGNPEGPSSVDKIGERIKGGSDRKVIYGGSVDFSNIKNYTSQENISGVLVGLQSLEAESFIKLINNVI